MKASGIALGSNLKLLIQRALSKGGFSQFLVPFGIAVIFWLLFVAFLKFMIMADIATMSELQSLRKDLGDLGIFEIAFYHLFASGDIDQLSVGPGWLIVIIGALLVASVTSVFTNFFEKLSKDYLDGHSDYRVKGHTAVLGFHSAVPELIRRMMDEGRSTYFLVLTSDVRQARSVLRSALGKKRMRRVLLLCGDMASSEDLKRMQLSRAVELHIAGDASAGKAGDEKCIRCLKNASSALKGRTAVPCFLLLESSATLPALQRMDTVGDTLALFPMSQPDMWAHKLFLGKDAVPFEGPEGMRPDASDHVHLIIFGMSAHGLALAREAALLAHYPNHILQVQLRTRISFIDPCAEERMQALSCELEGMFSLCRKRFIPAGTPVGKTAWVMPSQTQLGDDFMDLEWEFINGSVQTPSVREYLDESARDSHTRLTVAVCIEDDAAALDTALKLPESVLESALQIPVLQKEGDASLALLAEATTVSERRFRKFKAFGMKTAACDLPLIRTLIAEAAQLEKAPGKTAEPLSKSEAARMWSNLYNTAHASVKRRSAAASADWNGNLEELLARTEHARWNAEQLLLGFRPLTLEEQAYVLADEAQFATRKAELKRERLAHLDICSWERLNEIDPVSVTYDFNLVKQTLKH